MAGGRRRRKGAYPWGAWLSRLPVTLVRGKDFTGPVHGFVGTLRQAAKARGLYLRLKTYEGGVTVLSSSSSPQEMGARVAAGKTKAGGKRKG